MSNLEHTDEGDDNTEVLEAFEIASDLLISRSIVMPEVVSTAIDKYFFDLL